MDEDNLYLDYKFKFVSEDKKPERTPFPEWDRKPTYLDDKLKPN